LKLLNEHAPALIACARREKERRPRIAELEAECDTATGVVRLQKQHINELEGMLDKIPHLMVLRKCDALWCLACAWERMKGGGSEHCAPWFGGSHHH